MPFCHCGNRRDILNFKGVACWAFKVNQARVWQEHRFKCLGTRIGTVKAGTYTPLSEYRLAEIPCWPVDRVNHH